MSGIPQAVRTRPVRGEDPQKIVARVLATPKRVTERVRKIIVP